MSSEKYFEVTCVARRAGGLALTAVAALFFVLVGTGPAYAVTLTVNSAADPGTGGCNSTECTLREAINASNGLPTSDTIDFNIPDDPGVPGPEVKTITPTSQLPVITDNVTKDPDAGPNLLQNFPVITSASATRIQGTLNSRPRKTFTVQFFSSPAPNFPTGFGEGETFLGEKRVTTNRKGKASFTFTTTLSPGQVVTATATNAGGNTSEFSQARAVS